MLRGLSERKMALIAGLAGSAGTVVLWVVLAFFNPYTHDTSDYGNTLFTLVLPACLAFISSIFNQRLLMFVAFLWSLPWSAYMAMTPGIFALFGVTSLLYLISALFMKSARRRTE
jgi:hypothetical protein